MSTPTSSMSTSARQNIRYSGDINVPSMESPITRKKCSSAFRMQCPKLGKKVEQLQLENTRFENKIAHFHAVKNNLITENAAITLLVNFDNFDFTIYFQFC